MSKSIRTAGKVGGVNTARRTYWHDEATGMMMVNKSGEPLPGVDIPPVMAPVIRRDESNHSLFAVWFHNEVVIDGLNWDDALDVQADLRMQVVQVNAQ